VEALKTLPFLALVVILALAVSRVGKPLPEKKDQVPLPVNHRTFTGMEVNDDTSSADIQITDLSNGNTASLSLYEDGVYEPKKQSAGSPFKFEYTVHLKPIKIGLDPGWWGGFQSFQGEDRNSFDMGFRLSPARLLYGVVAPDLLLGTQSAGIGASFYLPTTIGTGIWKKIGIGGAWMAGYHGGGGWMPYASVTTSW
jgi:hypothetical protein